MLLSIDRVLQLLIEGKPVEKIAENAGVSSEEVITIIKDAKNLLLKLEGEKTKKKVILKKNNPERRKANTEPPSTESDEIFSGAELSAVPLGSFLMIYTDGESKGNPGPAGIGITINDKEDRTVGRISASIGTSTNNIAEYIAIIRAMKIALYFKTKDLRIRTDSELAVKQIKGIYKIANDEIMPFYDEIQALKKEFGSFRIEYIPRSQNEKAGFLAKSAVSGRK